MTSQPNNVMNLPTPAQAAFERFRQTLSLPLVKVRVDGNLMTYRLGSEREESNFLALARTICDVVDASLKVLPSNNLHGTRRGDYFVTIQYNG
jgi:hypothetical protein